MDVSKVKIYSCKCLNRVYNKNRQYQRKPHNIGPVGVPQVSY